MESILTSIKKSIGIEKEHIHFDPEIIMYSNAEFATLSQLGIGPKEGYRIDGYDSVWDDYIERSPLQNLVREYIPLKIKMVFDPSASSVVSDSLKSRIAELEWRMLVFAEDRTNE